MARVNLGRIRTVFKGEWAAAAYEVDDVVLYAGSAYTCIAVAASGNDPTDAAFWTKSAGGIEFMGVWDTAVTYRVDQMVTFNGSTYIAIVAHSATQPTTTGQTDWSVIVGGFKFEGVWDTSVAYHLNDIVTLNGSAFIAVSDHTGIQPAAAGNAGWVLYASGGDIADQTGNADKFLTTDGTSTTWGDVDSTFIDWSVLTANTNAVSGAAYIINTTSAAFTLTLPSSPSDNDYILINDGFGKFSTNSLTIVRSGNNISGLEEDLVCDVNYSSFRLTFKTSNGWFLT